MHVYREITMLFFYCIPSFAGLTCQRPGLILRSNQFMASLAGLFFSLVSIFGIVRCRAKDALKRIVLISFSVFLLLMQLLFISGAIHLAVDEFVGISLLVSGIILILALQKNEY